jgi:hypothetical protein
LWFSLSPSSSGAAPDEGFRFVAWLDGGGVGSLLVVLPSLGDDMISLPVWCTSGNDWLGLTWRSIEIKTHIFLYTVM